MNDARSLFSASDQYRLNQLAQQMQNIVQTSLIWENTDPVNIVAAGGWFASKLQGTTPRDVDIFILCGEDSSYDYRHLSYTLRNNASSRGISLSSSNSSGIPEYTKDKVWAIYTDNSKSPKIQYIFSKHKDRQKLLREFDYAHTMISYCMNHRKLYTTYKSFDAAKNKKLIINGNNKPKTWRKQKFLERGYINLDEDKSDMSDMPWWAKNVSTSHASDV